MKHFKLSHVPYVKNSAEEINLLQSKDLLAQKLHILWYGFRSTEGQIAFATLGSDEYIRLQNLLYGNIWCDLAAEILYSRNLLQKPTEEDCIIQKQGVCLWLHNSLFAHRGSEENYGKLQMAGMSYGLVPSKIATEEEQLQWLKEDSIEKMYSYKGPWIGKAAIEFLKKAPEVAIIKQLRYRTLKTEAEQLALIDREIDRNSNILLWYYFTQHTACPAAQKKIQAYDQNLWQEMILLNYGWDNEFEKKFGNLQIWREKLLSNISTLAHCPIDDIMEKLRSIA